MLSLYQGNLVVAECVLAEAEAISEVTQAKDMLRSVKQLWAQIALAEADLAKASSLLRTVLAETLAAGGDNDLMQGLEVWVAYTTQACQYEQTLLVAAALTSYYQQEEMVLPPLEATQLAEWLAKARDNLSNMVADGAWARGRRTTLREVAAVVLEREHQPA